MRCYLESLEIQFRELGAHLSLVHFLKISLRNHIKNLSPVNSLHLTVRSPELRGEVLVVVMCCESERERATMPHVRLSDGDSEGRDR